MFAAIISSCNGEITSTPLPANQSLPEKSALASGELFLDAESSAEAPSAAYVARSRVVKINLPLLLDENGRARELRGKEITLNLFPDVSYAGVIEQVEENGDSYTWIGHLKDVEFSALTIILTDGVFIAKIASPDGVYEVSSIGGDLYRVILINQENLGGEDEVDVNPPKP